MGEKCDGQRKIQRYIHTYKGHKPNLYKDGLQPTKTLDNAADVQADYNIEARGNSEAIRGNVQISGTIIIL